MRTTFTYVGAVTVAVLAVLSLYVAGLLVAALWGRFAPTHWWLSGPMRHAIPAHDVFRNVAARGGHASTFRRWLRLGPWAVYVIRYRAGDAPEETS